MKNILFVWVCAVFNTFVIDPIKFVLNSFKSDELYYMEDTLIELIMMGLCFIVVCIIISIPIFPEIVGIVYLYKKKDDLQEIYKDGIAILTTYLFLIYFVEYLVIHSPLYSDNLDIILGSCMTLIISIAFVAISRISINIIQYLLRSVKERFEDNLVKCSKK